MQLLSAGQMNRALLQPRPFQRFNAFMIQVCGRESACRNGKRKGSIGKHLPASDEKAKGINNADVAELVDARDLKSLDGNVVWVRVPPPAPAKIIAKPVS
jgi:hypothetical protein